jgi:hypothetical protein
MTAEQRDRKLEQRKRRGQQPQRSVPNARRDAEPSRYRGTGLYRPQPQVKVFRISLASLAACAVFAVPAAHAKTGNGLYEPFPTPESGGRAQVFIEGLAGSAGLIGLSGPDLQRGVLLERGVSDKPGPASVRGGSGGSGFHPSLGWPLALLLLAAVLAGTRLAVVRRA